MYITILVKQVYWYISRVSGERLQDHWSSGFFLPLKVENSQLKIFDIFHIFAQNIDCGRLEPSAVIYNLHACLHKSIPNVSYSLSAKRVLTGQN